MNLLDYLAPFASVIAALVAGIFSVIVETIKVKSTKSTDVEILLPPGVVPPKKKTRVTSYTLYAIAILISGLSTYLVASRIVSNAGQLPESEPLVQIDSPTSVNLPSPTPGPTPTKRPTPTPIAYGDLVMEINFAWRGEGQCNDYDSNRLGYDGKMYYIQPNAITKGYVAICHEKDDLLPQGALQVTAYPEKDSTYFGYGLLFGWNGGGVSTTDACIMGIRRVGSRTEAVFIDWVDGVYKSSTQRLDDITLDNQPHTLRVVLQPDGLGQGYLDGKYFAEHKFVQCNKGPIGMVAWNSGEKVYFDDLKFFDLP